MVFKPRIFISSTLAENLTIRNKIEKFFSEIGAETMLYEKNLTPSVDSFTYRKDILDADFVIFIIKEEYGALTDRGISGTHEELMIALNSNIPKHIYIKRSTGVDNGAKELREEIDKNNISYFYFKTDSELLTRLKQTSFTIAKEIMLKRVEDADLPRQIIKKICVKHDFSKAMEIVNIFESMIYLNSHYELDYIETSILDEFFEAVKFEKRRLNWFFVDKLLETKVDELLKLYDEFSEKHFKVYNHAKGSANKYSASILGEVSVYNLSFDNNADKSISRENLSQLVLDILNKYFEFKAYVGGQSVEAELIDKFS